MKYQEWLNGCGCCPDIQDCPPSTGNPCDCDSILLELSKQHTDDLVLQDEIDNLDEKKLDASAYTPDEYATEEWVNEQGFLKTVEPLKTINGESLIGEGDIVISGGSGDAYTKEETDALLDEKVNVVDNEVPQFIAQGDKLTRYYPASGTPETVFANMPVKMKVGTSGWEPQRIDDIIYINDENGFVASGNCKSRDQGVLTPRIPSELQPYLTVRAFYEGMNNLFEAKEGYRISYVDATMTDGSGQFEPYITPYFVAYEGGQSADVIKNVIEPTLINKQDTIIAGDYITIDSANTISTSGLVTVEDNEVEEYPVLTSDINDPASAYFNADSYDDAADVFEYITPGPTFESFDVSNSRFVFINESGETTADINGIYMFSTSGAVYPTRIQEYVNLDLYEYHTTDRYNVHLKYSCKNGWRLKQFFLYLVSDYSAGVEFKTYQNYPALQSADAISENVYPALEKLTANKFDKDFTCNDPLLYEAAYKRFRIKTSNQNNNTISASTSATTNLARAYDVKTYVESKIASGITSVPVYSGSALASVSINNPSGLDNGYNRISGNTSVGAGYMVETRNADEAAFGVYNLSSCEDSEVFNYDSGSTLFSVGNGHPHNTGGYIRKHNAFEIRQNGDIYYADTNDTEAEYPYEMPMIKLQDVIKNLQNEINTLKAQINGN